MLTKGTVGEPKILSPVSVSSPWNQASGACAFHERQRFTVADIYGIPCLHSFVPIQGDDGIDVTKDLNSVSVQ